MTHHNWNDDINNMRDEVTAIKRQQEQEGSGSSMVGAGQGSVWLQNLRAE